jgi:hypothetical protein
MKGEIQEIEIHGRDGFVIGWILGVVGEINLKGKINLKEKINLKNIKSAKLIVREDKFIKYNMIF